MAACRSKFWDERDQLLFQHDSGRGLGRYIADLGSLGGQDGVFDASEHVLHPPDVFSGYVGYEHWWSGGFRSSISFGIVQVNNLDIQADDALHLTRRSTVNFMWSPIPRMDLVTEFLWGRRLNLEQGTAVEAPPCRRNSAARSGSEPVFGARLRPCRE